MQDEQEMKLRIKRVVVKEALSTLRPEDVADDASLIDELMLDSIQVLELIVGLENEFDITLADEDLSLALFESVNTIAAYIREKFVASEAS